MKRLIGLSSALVSLVLGSVLVIEQPVLASGLVDDRVIVNSPDDGFLALRSEPTTKSGKRLAKIPHGTPLRLGVCQPTSNGSWCQTSYAGLSGWVLDRYVVPIEAVPTNRADPGRPSGGDRYAGLDDMMRIYSNPEIAPKVARCEENISCNAFVALSKQWESIPESYRYHGSDIRNDAKKGDGYGLNKGFTLNTERSFELSQAGEEVYYAGGSMGSKDEAVFARGLAVLLYIEDKNGWAD